MRVTIQKRWVTEAEIEAPDNLTEEELKDWLAEEADELPILRDMLESGLETDGLNDFLL